MYFMSNFFWLCCSVLRKIRFSLSAGPPPLHQFVYLPGDWSRLIQVTPVQYYANRPDNKTLWIPNFNTINRRQHKCPWMEQAAQMSVKQPARSLQTLRKFYPREWFIDWQESYFSKWVLILCIQIDLGLRTKAEYLGRW